MKPRLLTAFALITIVSLASSGSEPVQARDPHPLLPGSQRGQLAVVLGPVAVPPTHSISGTVYELDSVTPITTTARVEALNATTGLSVGFAFVDAGGAYTIGGLADGAYHVSATAQGRAREFYEEAGASFADATPILIDGGNITDINFTLGPGGTIQGIVYAVDGITPLGNVSVATDFAWGVICTASDGTYKLSYLPLITPLRVQASGQDVCLNDSGYVREWWYETTQYDLAQPIALTAGHAVQGNINFTLQTGGSISGQVFKADGTTPIEGALVFAEQLGTGNGNSDHTDGSGHYQIDGLGIGDFRVRAEANGYAVEYYNNAGSIAANATPVGVSGGGITPNINFTLDPGGTISGVVHGADGVTPLARVNVGLDTGSPTACTNLSGAYTITNVPFDVPHTVFAGGENSCPAGWDGYGREWWLDAPHLASADPITLTLGQPSAVAINFTLTWNLYLPALRR